MARPELITYQQQIEDHRKTILSDALHRFTLAHGQDRLIFGPVYEVTSRGQTLEFATFVFDERGHEHWSGKPTRNFLILGRNQARELVCYRQTYLNREMGYLEARGSISTFGRGQGIVVPAELVHIDLLINEATRRDEDIYYNVENGNLATLQLAEKQFESKSEATGLLSSLRAEQVRWMAVYGPTGLLGVGNYGTLQIMTQHQMDTPLDLEETERIVLERLENDSQGRRLVFGYRKSIVMGQKDLVVAKKRQGFEEFWLPAVRELGAD